MKSKLVILGVLLLVPIVLLAGSGVHGDGELRASAEATLEAQVVEAQLTPVNDTMRAYARQLCEPLLMYVREVDEAFDEQATREMEAVGDGYFGELFFAAGLLKDIHRRAASAFAEIDPPPEALEFHEGQTTAWRLAADYAELLDLMTEDEPIDDISELDEFSELIASFDSPQPEPPDSSDVPGLDAAILQECGDGIRDAFDSFDWEREERLLIPTATRTPRPTATWPPGKPSPTQLPPELGSYVRAMCGAFAAAWGDAPYTPEERELRNPGLAEDLRAIEPTETQRYFHELLTWQVENSSEEWTGATPAPDEMDFGTGLIEILSLECGGRLFDIFLAPTTWP